METSAQSHINDDFLNFDAFCEEEAKSIIEGMVNESLPVKRGKGMFKIPTTLPALPDSTNRWDPRLILDLAFAIDPLEDILPRYDLSEAEFELLSRVPTFRRELAVATREVRENGLTFTRKAQFQAESYLEVLDALVYDEATPANIRLEAIRSTVKWADLEPREEKKDGVNATQVNVNISF